jgi:hypothetical protein
VTWFNRPFLVWMALGLLACPGFAVPAASQESCLDSLLSEVSADETIVIVEHDGTSTSGKFLRFSPEGQELWLSVYDAHESRFRERPFTGPSIRSIRLHRVRVNMTVPLLLGIGFGGGALALGATFAEDSAESGSRAKAVAIMTGIGFLTGFITGYGVAWAGRRVEDHTFTCRP